ncbi:MAG: transposase [Myxococcales bacterium]|nr:transposase [Myxococcales bacterium]
MQAGVRYAVQYRDLGGKRAIGVDEVLWHRGHEYLTTRKCFEEFFDWFGPRARWLRYLDVIAPRAKLAVHVLDRFHVVQRLGKVVDEVRAQEAKRLERDGYEPAR